MFSREILEPRAASVPVSIEGGSSHAFGQGRSKPDADWVTISADVATISADVPTLPGDRDGPCEDVRSKWDKHIQTLDKALFGDFLVIAEHLPPIPSGHLDNFERRESNGSDSGGGATLNLTSNNKRKSGSSGTVTLSGGVFESPDFLRVSGSSRKPIHTASKTPNNPEEWKKLLFEAALAYSLASVKGCSVAPLFGLLALSDKNECEADKVKCEFVFRDAGKSLFDLGDELQGFSLDKKLKIATTVTKTVLSLHALGVAHCDIHTGNILYHEKDDKTYLIDFGMAQLFNYHESKPEGIPAYARQKSKDEAIRVDALKLWDLWNELFKSELDRNNLQTSYKDHPFAKFCQGRVYTPSTLQGSGSGSRAATQRNEETERRAIEWYNTCSSQCHPVLVGSHYFRRIVQFETEADKTELIELLRSSGLGFEDIVLDNSFCQGVWILLKLAEENSKRPGYDPKSVGVVREAEEFLRKSKYISALLKHLNMSGLKNEAKKLRESFMRVYIIFMGLEESKKWLVHGSSSIKFFDYIEHFADSALSYKGDMLKEYVRIAISILKDFGEFQKGSNSPPYPWISDGTAKEAQRSLGRAAMDGYGQMYLLKENYLQVCLHIIKCLEGQPKQDPSFYTSLAKCLGWFDRQRHAKSNYFRELDKELGHLIESDPEKYLHQRIQIEQSNLGRVGIVLHFVSTYSSFFVTELFSSKVSL